MDDEPDELVQLLSDIMHADGDKSMVVEENVLVAIAGGRRVILKCSTSQNARLYAKRIEAKWKANLK